MSLTAQEIFALRTELIHQRRWSDLAEHYAADAVVDMPFALPEPVRLQGRPAIEAHLATAARAPLYFTVENVVIHQTADPEVIIAEYDYLLSVTTTGKTLRVSNIQLFKVRNGQIVETRDYHDHHRIREALA
jgi:ketosteroid isomerase-like protein